MIKRRSFLIRILN